VAPKIEDAEGQIRQALQMKLRNEFVNQIISTAKVQLAD
jgi:hypothetical protein